MLFARLDEGRVLAHLERVFADAIGGQAHVVGRPLRRRSGQVIVAHAERAGGTEMGDGHAPLKQFGVCIAAGQMKAQADLIVVLAVEQASQFNLKFSRFGYDSHRSLECALNGVG